MSTTEVFEQFITSPLHGETLKEGMIPALGKAGVAKLAAAGITTPQKVMGLFCLFNCEKEPFVKYLETLEVKEYLGNRLADALWTKSEDFQSNAPTVTSGSKKGDGSTTTVLEAFATNPLLTCPLKAGMVPGLGEKLGVPKASSTIKAKLQSLGNSSVSNTPTSVQLLGVYLDKDREGFETWLTKDLGCKSNDATRTVAAFADKASKFCGPKKPRVATPPRLETIRSEGVAPPETIRSGGGATSTSTPTSTSTAASSSAMGNPAVIVAILAVFCGACYYLLAPLFATSRELALI